MTEHLDSDIDTLATGARAAIRVGIIGAAGYVGGELIRLLERHPDVHIAGLQGRDRDHEPVTVSHPQLAGSDLHIEADLPDVDAVFLALPHGASAPLVPELVAQGRRVIDLGADYRLRNAADYERWYGFRHPAPGLLKQAVYGLPEQHRAELRALQDAEVAVVGAPGCYPTTTLLGLYPLARAGLIADLVVDAKSGTTGAGRAARADLVFSEVNESVKAYGISGHRHVAELEQELQAAGPTPAANPGVQDVDFVPHLIPMQRGILAACHVRPTRPVSAAQLRDLYEAAYADEPFVRVVDQPPATSHVRGSNVAHVHPSLNERTGRILVISVLDNLVKGAAGQAIQAFNLVFGLPEVAGLQQLALVP